MKYLILLAIALLSSCTLYKDVDEMPISQPGAEVPVIVEPWEPQQ